MGQANVDQIHGTLPDQTFERLRDLIVRGRIRPGVRVTETGMALRFGISRTPVREALARLVQDGYLVPVSSGMRTELVVPPVTGAGIRELWGMIGALEGYAVQAVASLPEVRRLALAADLKDLNVELRKAAATRPRNPDRLFELQSAFHIRFVHETAGPRLRSVYDSIRPHVQRYEWLYGTQRDAAYEPSTTEHLRIIAAIRKGDPVEARDAVESHWKNAASRTVHVIEEMPHDRPRRVARRNKT